jgi:hypothetical protein
MCNSNRQLEFTRPTARTSRNGWLLWLPACALALASMDVGGPALARSGHSFDGIWSVVIETRGGACPATLRYPVTITRGTVTNADGTPAAVSGHVTPAGTVRVTVKSGSSWANGSGHLGTTSGTGVWRGQGTNGSCLGTWQAERRSANAQAIESGAPIYNYVPERAHHYYSHYPDR